MEESTVETVQPTVTETAEQKVARTVARIDAFARAIKDALGKKHAKLSGDEYVDLGRNAVTREFLTGELDEEDRDERLGQLDELQALMATAETLSKRLSWLDRTHPLGFGQLVCYPKRTWTVGESGGDSNGGNKRHRVAVVQLD